MEISKKCNHPAFTAKFIPNKAFKEVIGYAEQTKQLRSLDNALNNIKNANEGDILIMHGLNGDNVYSNFTMNRRSVFNLGGKTPEEATFNGILELGTLGRKFRKLIGGDVKENIKAEDILKRYSSDANI